MGPDVAGFTCHQGTGDFRLTHPDMKFRARSEFAINTSRYRYWDAPVRRYVDECVAEGAAARVQHGPHQWWPKFTASRRAAACFVSTDSNNRDAGGKLRLMYEANPMAMITGGAASTNFGLMDLQPSGGRISAYQLFLARGPKLNGLSTITQQQTLLNTRSTH
jgi:fructose-1,6-bisphosphatase I